MISAFLFAAATANAEPLSMKTPKSSVTVPGMESLAPKNSPAPITVVSPEKETKPEGIVRSNEVQGAPIANATVSSPAAKVATKVAGQTDIQSLVPLAMQYNNYCKLGLSPITLQLIAAQAESMRSSGQLPEAVISKNVNIAKQKYAQNPTQFCAEAQGVANIVRNMYPMVQMGSE